MGMSTQNALEVNDFSIKQMDLRIDYVDDPSALLNLFHY